MLNEKKNVNESYIECSNNIFTFYCYSNEKKINILNE